MSLSTQAFGILPKRDGEQEKRREGERVPQPSASAGAHASAPGEERKREVGEGGAGFEGGGLTEAQARTQQLRSPPNLTCYSPKKKMGKLGPGQHTYNESQTLV